MSELVTYFFRSPDPMVAGCLNTRDEATDGVVFNGIEPQVGAFCFVGRQSIIEAVGALYDIDPGEVKKRLEKRGPGRPKKGVNGEG